MTQMPHHPHQDGRAQSHEGRGPTTDSFTQVLAELRDISQQVGQPEEPPVSFPPRSSRIARGRGTTKLRVKTGPKWPARIAVGGGILLVTGLLAVPVRDAMFGRKATNESLASPALAITAVPPAKPAVVAAAAPPAAQTSADALRSSPSATSSILPIAAKQDLARTEPAKPIPEAAVQAPTPAAPPRRVEADVSLPPVRLPEPLNLAGMEPPPVPNREVVPAPKIEAASVPLVQPVQPQAEASTGTRVAALSDVPIASAQKPTPPADPATTALLARAQEMIRMRDISSARLLLERMLQTGSAQAAFELAQTYDPAMLLEWKVRGLSGDAVKARELYTLASERGSSKAGERLQALK